ncbi:MAG TPA: NADH-quinone oxidoreductase subunit L, partial [Isosphaeraceae bacterium]
MIWVYVAAVLIPLGAFAVEALGGRWLGRLNAYIATGAIVASFVLSLVGFFGYVAHAPAMFAEHHAAHGEAEAPEAPEGPATTIRHAHEPLAWEGHLDWVTLGTGLRGAAPALTIPLGVHIDNLAAIMFVMVTFIASLIHIYSISYMH